MVNNMKKISILLVITLLLMSMPLVLSASAEVATFAVGQVTATPGEEVTVPVTISGNPGIIAFRISIAYDANVLEVVSMTKNTANSFSTIAFSPVTKNPLTMTWDESLSPNDTTNGDIAYITFKVKDTAATGASPLTITYDQADVFNDMWEDVVFATQKGSVTVEAVGNTADDIVSILGATIKTDTEIANQGMRYEIKVGHEEAIADVQELGILLIPASYLGSTELTVDTSAVVKLSTVRGDSNWDAIIADGGFQATLLESTIQGRQNWEIASRAYAVLSSGDVIYGETSVKSVTSVALAIANTAISNGAVANDEIEALLAKETLGDVEIADILTFCRDNIDML